MTTHPSAALPVDPNARASQPDLEPEVMYQLVKRAEITPSEVEDLARSAMEVTVLWQRSVLHVAHLEAGRDFVLSGSPSTERDDPSRFVMDPEVLGLDEVAVLRQGDGAARFVFIPGAKGEVELDGVKRSLADLVAAGIARPSTELAGAHEVTVLPGGKYRTEVGGIAVMARVVAAGRKVAGHSRKDGALRASTLVSGAVMALLMGALKLAVAGDASYLSAEDSADRLDALRAFMDQQASRPDPRVESPEAAATGTTSGRAAAGAAGAMGDVNRPNTHRRYVIRRVDDNPRISNQTARQQVENRGVFAAMGAPTRMAVGASGISSPFGAMTESGTGDRSIVGNMDGNEVGESGGYNGIDTIGTGWGGGGDGRDTIGGGTVGTQGHGSCTEGENCRTYGDSAGRRLRNRENRGPRVEASRPVVAGISPEVIRRVVLRNLSQVNHCYEQGLSSNAQLAGRVSVRFVIGSGGTVLGSTVADDNLGMPSVSSCIAGAVRRWSFDVPADTGAITVTYPFSLMPAD